VLGSQLRDLRTVIRWLAARDELDGKKIGVWGDSFAKTNPGDVKAAVPLDADNLPALSEPGAAELASLAGMYEKVTAVYRCGAINMFLLDSAYLYCPHDAIVPGMFVIGGRVVITQPERSEGWVDGHNRGNGEPISFPDAVKWMLKELKK
jgi:hypothetical protein